MCETCDNAVTCQKCKANSNRLKDASRYPKCPCEEGYFDNGVALCVECHYSCRTCENEKTCKECVTGRIKDNLCNCPKG